MDRQDHGPNADSTGGATTVANSTNGVIRESDTLSGEFPEG